MREYFNVIETALWLCLLYVTFSPARYTPVITIAGIPISLYDVALIPLSCYLSWSLVARTGFQRARWACGIPLTFVLLLLYAGISMLWTDLDGRNSRAMLFTILLAGASLFAGYSTVAAFGAARLHAFLWRLTVFIALASFLYFLESYFDLGFRSAEDKAWTDFGIQRLKGPLFGASTGHFLLLPALGFAVQSMINRTTGIIQGLCVTCMLTVSLLALGSRAALLCLAAFVLLAVWMAKGAGRKLGITLLLGSMLAVSAITVFSRASANRLTSDEEDYRLTTYKTSLSALATGGYKTFIGRGYGGMWPWYLTDQLPRLIYSSSYYYNTPVGYTLYHPHSTVVLLIVELGAAGLIFLMKLGITLWRMLVRCMANNQYRYFACAVAASSLAGFVDLYLFKCGKINFVWWLFFFGALRLSGRLNQFSSNAPGRRHNSTGYCVNERGREPVRELQMGHDSAR